MVRKPFTDNNNPFPGMRPFNPEDSNMFFGREAECRYVLNKLLSNRFITVIGASGCGKSSFINCAVIPGMKDFAQQEDSTLQVVSFRPGSDPAANMADAFAYRSKVIESTSFREMLSESHTHEANPINTAVKTLIKRHGDKVLIIIDQFEDIFTYSAGKQGFTAGNNSEFVALLESAINNPVSDLYLVVVLRSENVGDCAGFHGLTNLINSSSYLLPQMVTANYRSVIENQLSIAGAEFDPDLVNRIISDIADQSYPLLRIQHALMRTYSYWSSPGETGRPLDASDYIAVGTIKNAIAEHAEELYGELSYPGRETCGKLFKAITFTGADRNRIRHPLSIEDIRSLTQCSDESLSEVIEKFRHPSIGFITTYSQAPLSDNSIIDISNECLIVLWDRLKVWVDEESSSAVFYRRLSEASALFQKGKISLLKNPELQLAADWREKQKPTLKWAERYDSAFERTMVYLRASEKANIEEEEIKRRRQGARFKNNRIIAVLFGVVAIITCALLLFVFVKKLESDRKRSEAAASAVLAEKVASLAAERFIFADSCASEAKRRENEALNLNKLYINQKEEAEKIASEARKMQFLAIEKSDSALEAAKVAEDNAIISNVQKEEAIRRRMVSVGKSMALKSLQLSGQKDLQTLLAYQAYNFNKSNGGSSADADIFSGLYNVAKLYGNNSVKSFAAHEGDIKSVAFIPGKQQFFTSGTDGKVLRWDPGAKNQSFQVIYSGDEVINVLAVSHDAGWLAMGGQNAMIKVVPLKEDNISFELNGHTDAVRSLIFSYDGRYLYSSSLDGIVLKWDLTTKTSTIVSGRMMQITTIDLSTDNKYIAGIGKDGRAIVWNPDVTTDKFNIGSDGKEIRTVRFKPDENKIAIGYSDGFVEIWDLVSRKIISAFRAHDSEVNEIRFNTSLSQMATAGNDMTIKLWDTDDITSMPLCFDDCSGFVLAIDFSPDGQVIVSGSSGGGRNLTLRPACADILAKNLCNNIARNFTADEWRAYAGKDIEYAKTCPDAEFKIRVEPVK